MVTPVPAPVPPGRPASAGAPGLDRRLGPADAVLVGVGSMLGAGIFAALAPAARAAGGGLLLGLGLAAVVAYANAMSTAQLAAVIPEAGGAYRYGRDRLGPWWGFTAGWGFVVGKTASCAAMAATFAVYAMPGAEQVAAVVAVVVLVAVNERGITRTAGLTRVLVTVTLAVLAVVVVAGAVAVLRGDVVRGGPGDGPGRLVDVLTAAPVTVPGVLQSAGLLFFAMAGYARVATLGGEVRDPARVIPRAVTTALGLVLVVYGVVAVVALGVLGPERLGGAEAPLAEVLEAAGRPELVWLVRAGAAAACLGALLGLLAGVSRTTWAMARERDLPRPLAVVHPRFRTPHVAERVVGVAVVVLVLVADVTTLIGFSSFGVLVYYGVANAAALTQRGAERRWPRALHVVGLLGCAALAVSLPPAAALPAAGVLALGVSGRAVAGRARARRAAVRRSVSGG